MTQNAAIRCKMPESPQNTAKRRNSLRNAEISAKRRKSPQNEEKLCNSPQYCNSP